MAISEKQPTKERSRDFQILIDKVSSLEKQYSGAKTWSEGESIKNQSAALLYAIAVLEESGS